MERTRIWASGALIGTAMVSTGRISASTGPAPMTFTRPSRKEKIWIRTIASQKVGTETNTEGRLASALRSQAHLVQVAVKATINASTTAAANASVESRMVCGSTSASRPPTAAPFWIENPKSPRTKPASVCR